MEHLEEGTIHAWLDGELSDEQGRAIEAHVATCETCSAAVAEARGFIALSARVLTSLDDVPSGVVPREAMVAAGQAVSDDVALARERHRVAASASMSRRPWWRNQGLLAAAVVAFVAVGSFPVWRTWQEKRSASAPAAEMAELRAPVPAVADSTNLALDAVARKATSSSQPRAGQGEPAAGATERKKKALDGVADAAFSPATTIATPRADAPKPLKEQAAPVVAPLGRAAVLSDSAQGRRSADESARQQLGAVVTTGAASEARAKVADQASNRVAAPAAPPRPTEASERERMERDASLPSLLGCYAVRLVAVGGGPMTIAAVRLPTHLALDSVRVAGSTSGEYEARDVSPDAERVSGVYRWRPTGRGSFDVIVVRDGATLQFAAVTGANPSASGGPVTPMPAGAPVRLAATREPCR